MRNLTHKQQQKRMKKRSSRIKRNRALSENSPFKTGNIGDLNYVNRAGLMNGENDHFIRGIKCLQATVPESYRPFF